MAQTPRHGRWQHWHKDLCSRFPEVQHLQAEEWPVSLAVAVEDIFADQSRPEAERLTKVEQEVLTHYTRDLPAGSREELQSCLAEAVRLQVQNDFEHWKIDASVA